MVVIPNSDARLWMRMQPGLNCRNVNPNNGSHPGPLGHLLLAGSKNPYAAAQMKGKTLTAVFACVGPVRIMRPKPKASACRTTPSTATGVSGSSTLMVDLCATPTKFRRC
jgi:hypothetical protein